MRKIILILFALLGLSISCSAQNNTVVTATVLDPNSIPYAFGTGSASLVCPGNQQPTFNGFTVQRNYTIVGMDGNGTFSQVLFDVNRLDQTGCSYRYAITYKDGVTSFTAYPVGGSGSSAPVTGPGPVNLSSQINMFAVPLPAIPFATPPGGLNGQIQFNNSGSFGGIVGSSVTPATGAISLSSRLTDTGGCTIGTPLASFTAASQADLANWYSGAPLCTMQNQVQTSGSQAPSLMVLNESSATTAENVGFISYSEATNASSSGFGSTGLYGWAKQQATGTGTDYLNGVNGRTSTASNGTITRATGVQAEADLGNGTATGTVTTAADFLAADLHIYSPETVVNKYGYFAGDMNAAGTQAASTITAVYHTGTQTTCATCWDFWGANKSSFGEQVNNCNLTSSLPNCVVITESTATSSSVTNPHMILVQQLTGSSASPFAVDSTSLNAATGQNAAFAMFVGGIKGGLVSSTASNGFVGAPISLLAGAGSPGGSVSGTGGTGGQTSIASGGGGNATATAATGGTGGNFLLSAASGGNGGATGNGGNAGGIQINFTGQTGGNGGATSGNGGSGPFVTIDSGPGGTAASGTTGAGGDIVIGMGAAGLGAGTPGRPGELLITQGAVTGSNATPTIVITPTWNTSGVIDAALKIAVTDTASGAGSLIMDLLDGLTSEFKVDKSGATTATGPLTAPSFISNGSGATITGTGACATITTQAGGSSAGTFKCTGTTGASTITIAPAGPAAANGWTCNVYDETTRADNPGQTSHSTTQCVVTSTTTVQNDVFSWSAQGY